MFFKKNELERRLRCEDRGPVSDKSDGRTLWFTSCSLCNSRAHVVIKESGKRDLACPRCLVFLKEKDPEETVLETLNKIEKLANSKGGKKNVSNS